MNFKRKHCTTILFLIPVIFVSIVYAEICEDCAVEWLSTTDLTGGMECGHGAEYDQDCVTIMNAYQQAHPNATDAELAALLNQICFELNGNLNVTTTINGQVINVRCSCFACNQTPECEE